MLLTRMTQFNLNGYVVTSGAQGLSSDSIRAPSQTLIAVG